MSKLKQDQIAREKRYKDYFQDGLTTSQVSEIEGICKRQVSVHAKKYNIVFVQNRSIVFNKEQDAELIKCINQGMSMTATAKHLGFARRTIKKQIKRLGIEFAKSKPGPKVKTITVKAKPRFGWDTRHVPIGYELHLKKGDKFLHMTGEILTDSKDFAWRGSLRQAQNMICLLYTSPSPRDATLSRMPSSA